MSRQCLTNNWDQAFQEYGHRDVVSHDRLTTQSWLLRQKVLTQDLYMYCRLKTYILDGAVAQRVRISIIYLVKKADRMSKNTAEHKL